MYKYVCVFASPHIKEFIVKIISGGQERALTVGQRQGVREGEAQPRACPRRLKPDKVDDGNDHGGTGYREYFRIF